MSQHAREQPEGAPVHDAFEGAAIVKEGYINAAKVELNQAAATLGRLGGKARAASMTKEQLSRIGFKGGKARKRRLSKARRSEIARGAGLARAAKAQAEANGGLIDMV